MQRYVHSKFVRERAVLSRAYSAHIQLWQRAHKPSGPVSILEMGCGESYFASLFPPQRYLGFDISDERIRAARLKHPGYRFMVADVTDTKFKEIIRDFDFIFCNSFLHHLDDNTCKGLIEDIKLYAKKPAGLVAIEPVLPVAWQNPLGFLLCKLDLGHFIRTPQATAALFIKASSVDTEELNFFPRWPVDMRAYTARYE